MKAAVALGSNQGDRVDHLRRAVAALRRLGDVTAMSSVYETVPVGGPPQGPYLNAVVVLRSDLGPLELLDSLLGIESEEGRMREERWGPRTLDLDIIALAGENGETVEVDMPRLVVPHPRASERRFVLEPLVEVWPDADVGEGTRAVAALARVEDQDVLPTRYVITPGQGPSFALVIAQVALLAAYAGVLMLTGQLPVRPSPSNVAGLLVLIAGVAVVAWASASLGRSLTPMPAPTPGATVVESGPYRWVRHPIYAGVVLVGAGLSVALASAEAALFLIPLLVFFWFKARYEERLCAEQLEGYPRYLRKVRGRFLPLPPRRRPPDREP